MQHLIKKTPSETVKFSFKKTRPRMNNEWIWKTIKKKNQSKKNKQ